MEEFYRQEIADTKLTKKELANFKKENKQQLGEKKSLTIEAVYTDTKKEALNAQQAIKDGMKINKVIKEFGNEYSQRVRDGRVGVTDDQVEWSPLAKAVFKQKHGTVGAGPVELTDGTFVVFSVREKPLIIPPADAADIKMRAKHAVGSQRASQELGDKVQKVIDEDIKADC